MKKCFWLVLIILLVAFKNNVFALEYVNNVFNVNLIEDKNINEEQEIIVGLDLKVSYDLMSIIGDLSYDKSKLELVKCESNFYSCTYNDKLLLDGIVGVSGSKNISSLTFNVLSGFNPGNDVLIELKNVKGDNNTVGNDTKVKIHKLQTDNTLQSLLIPNETLIPSFSPDVTIYKVITYNSTINIEALSLSNVKNGGIKELQYGNNIFKLIVTSETNAEKTYIINVFREKEVVNNNDDNKQSNSEENNSNEQNSKNNDTKEENKESQNIDTNEAKKETKKNSNKVSSTKLSSNKKVKFIKITGTDFVFNENVFEYSIHLNNDIEKLNIDYELVDKKSKLVISGDTNLAKKQNIITISIIAEDGSQVDYKINVTKDIDNPVKIEKNADLNTNNKIDKNDSNKNVKNGKSKINRFLIYYFIVLGISIVIVVINLIWNRLKKK